MNFQDAISRGIVGAGLDVVQYGWVMKFYIVLLIYTVVYATFWIDNHVE